MKLKRLEIFGFKSFAQRTDITFNQGITGIVGPNGSGKSNISDAVRWVLGEQSAKALRGAKMEDVIFNGTQKRKAMPYCEVSLIFDNEDGALNTKYAEVMVTRRVYRSGEGEYYLNKTACRLKDIIELFRDTGIGREGYSIIGQGRIDDILSARGEERRQVFEEAAGIVTYRVRKEEAERSLQKTRDNLLRVNDLIEEIGLRLDPLKEQAEAAREYIDLTNRLKDLELNIYLVRHGKLKERIESMSQTMLEQEKLINDTNQELAENAALRSQLEQEQEKMENALQQARAMLEEKSEEVNAARSEREKKLAKLSAQETEIARLDEMNQENAQRIEELTVLSTRGDEDKEETDKKLKLAQEALAEESGKLDQLIAAADEAEEKLNLHKDRLLQAVNRMTDVKSLEARQQTMLTQMRKRLGEVVHGIEDLQREEEALEAAHLKAQQQVVSAQQQLKVLQEDVAALEDDLAGKTKQLSEIDEEMRALTSKLQSDASRLNLMEEMSKGYEGYYGAVRKAIEYARDNPKVHGVVARLIRVPKAYETAIDMILGGTLQHIVTEDEETAKRLIDYLRTNRLGRTTFLPLTAIKPRLLQTNERRALEMPGCVGIASEMIGFDEKFRPVVENILGRTVIARDLDAAIGIMRAGKHGFNVVTLEGDVMRAGGAMTGGTSQNQSISLLGREREIKELREAIGQQQQMLMELEKQKAQFAKQREETKRLRSEAFDRLHDEEIVVARDQERAQNARGDLDTNQKRLRDTLDAQNQLEQSIIEIEQDLEKALNQSRDVDIDREAMERKTLELQEALAALRNDSDVQRDKVSRHQEEYISFVHAVDMLHRDRKRWQEEMSALGDRLQRNQTKRKILFDEFVIDKERASQQETNIEKLVHIRQQADENVQLVDTERRNLTKRQRELSEETDQLHASLNDLSSKYHKSEMVHARTQDELQTMTDHIWNTYELTYSGAEAYRFETKFELPAGEREANRIKGDIRDMGPINIHAVEEYAQTKSRFDSMVTQRDDAQKAENDLVELIRQLLGEMEKQFVAEFEKLNVFFGETFERLFGGGQAELKLTDPQQPLTCGIDIVAQPPGKKLQLLSLLSGGERALTAIAILFAMLKLKPTPFCVLDEIEAALDDANIGYFADYLAEYAQTTQFIVVTHRKGTMERCDALYGVAMQEKGVSGMVSVNLENYA